MTTSESFILPQSPLVSVIIPVYNGHDHLAKAVDSILEQTFLNLELILVDDGSKDGSPQILQEYEQKDSRVRFVVRENLGLAATLNELVELAQGEWIARMDQDDIALPHRLARQLEWLDETGADICGSWVQRFGSADKRIVRLHQSDQAIKAELLFCSPFAHPSVIMRASMIKELRYDSAWEKAEDYDLWERAAESGWKMTNIPEVLLFYRVHPTQISTSTVSLQQQQGQKIRRRYWRFVFNSKRLDQKWIDETMKVFAPPVIDVNMDAVDMALTALLKNFGEESRGVVFFHATRIYLMVAASCPDIVSRWGQLNQQFGVDRGIRTKMKLCLFRVFRIRENDLFFRWLKKLYILRASV